MAAKKKDCFYGLDILEKKDFEKLTVLPPYTVVNETKEYCFHYKKIQVVNGQYVSRFDKAKGDITLGIIDEKYKVPALCSRVAKLPKQYTKLKEVLTNLYSSDEKTTVYMDICSENLAGLLSFFTVYPDFGPVYEEYILKPDECIELAEDIEVVGTKMPGRLITEDVKATAHILLLLMAKTFNEHRVTMEDQISKYLYNRLYTLQPVLLDNNIKCLLTTKYLHRMSDIWSTYPKLKSTVFYFAMSVIPKAPEMHAASMIIAECLMVNLVCISRFLRAQPETIAHIDYNVCQETRTFLRKCTKLKEVYGSLWPYYRIFRTDDTILSAMVFPYLTRAAVVYCKKFCQTNSFFRSIVIPPYPPFNGIVNAAKTILSGMSLQERTENRNGVFLTSEERQLAVRLADDIDRWGPPKVMRRPLRTNIPGEEPIFVCPTMQY